MYREAIKSIVNIEDDFFDIDKEKKVANIVLNFDKPDDIFDLNYNSKIPVLSDDFLDWIASAFRIIPRRYKIKLDVRFRDLQGYDAETLEKIFEKNIVLEYVGRKSGRIKENKISWSLIGLGTVLLLATIFMNLFWQTDGIAKEIIMYVFDIAVTVTFWEAFTSLIVKRQEIFGYRKDLVTRFSAITFHGPGETEDKKED